MKLSEIRTPAEMRAHLLAAAALLYGGER